jgi:hypothetical protein
MEKMRTMRNKKGKSRRTSTVTLCMFAILVCSCLASLQMMLRHSIPNESRSGGHRALRGRHASERQDICFITYEFAADEHLAMETVQNLTDLGLRMSPKDSPDSSTGKFRYMVLTNMENYDTKDWERVVVHLDPSKYKRTKTHTVYANFLAWKLPETQSCRMIFTMDGLFTPVNIPEVWYDLEARIQESRDKFLVQLKPNNRTVLGLLERLPRFKKDTKENMNRTREWLYAQPDFDEGLVSTYTNIMGYDPTSTMYQRISESFWEAYSTETTTPRDQPLFSYFVFNRYHAEPALLHTSTPGIYEVEPHVNLCRIGDTQYDFDRLDRENVTVYEMAFDRSKLDCRAKEEGHDYSGLVTFPPTPKLT